MIPTCVASVFLNLFFEMVVFSDLLQDLPVKVPMEQAE
jgi:hypothetical protein